MYILLLIGLGGFIGAVSRYLLGELIQNGGTFPIETLSINFIGSLLLGIVMYASEEQGFLSEEARIFLTIGVLGAFTTMSTFGYQSFKLFENDEFVLFGINLIGTIFLTLFAVYLGKLIVLNLCK